MPVGLSLLTLFALAAPTSPPVFKTFSYPHVLETSGKISSIVYDVTGGQPATNGIPTGKRQHRPIGFYWIPEVQDEFATAAFASVSNCMPLRALNKLHRLSRGREAGGQIAFTSGLVTEITMPALDAGAKEPAYVKFSIEAEDLNFQGFFPPSPAETAAYSKAKAWMVNNYEVHAIGVSKKSAISTSEIKIQQTRVQSDASETQLCPLTLEIPLDEVAAYMEWFRSSESGKPAYKPLDIQIRDENGGPLIRIQSEVMVTSIGYVDLFTNGGTVQVIVEGKKGLNAVNVKLA
ncbi:MAG: hypothetical protein ACAH95_03515 [Fimbriimonas sp.]